MITSTRISWRVRFQQEIRGTGTSRRLRSGSKDDQSGENQANHLAYFVKKYFSFEICKPWKINLMVGIKKK